MCREIRRMPCRRSVWHKEDLKALSKWRLWTWPIAWWYIAGYPQFNSGKLHAFTAVNLKIPLKAVVKKQCTINSMFCHQQIYKRDIIFCWPNVKVIQVRMDMLCPKSQITGPMDYFLERYLCSSNTHEILIDDKDCGNSIAYTHGSIPLT